MIHMTTRSLGIDIGSTTTKLVLTEGDQIIAQRYERHRSQVWQATLSMLRELAPELEKTPFTAAISGSAGMGLAQAAELPFVQEVYATAEAVKKLAPDTGMVIELGGEDAKVIFFAGGVDERMNGTCAGGTGAFIDQMASLLDMTVDEMDAASLTAEQLYPIASRCGVFAKSDIQPLLNQGARKADVAASIYQAVVNQTITGLIQGRSIRGKVLFLGGPLHYCQGLRKRFVETLRLSPENAVFPDYDRFAVAIGASLYAKGSSDSMTCAELLQRITSAEGKMAVNRARLAPLFETEADYEAFRARHAKASVARTPLENYRGKAWLGIDCGSTTTKLTLIAEDKSILYSYYSANRGDPVALVREQLRQLYALCGDRVQICGSAATGYGEELICHAFHVDHGLVETIAHYTAARHFRPEVDFILDIGGQDIKCFHIKNGLIDGILLNEACSSGCGSFLESFARSMGYTPAEFAREGLKAQAPVDLGSRCTVFMNSSVKQAQKDGASVADISAGLSISVVKNALYKVIRVHSAQELGRCVVVQGGTFANDAVLRAFEMETGAQVLRPAEPGLMGAYGAALYAMTKPGGGLLDAEALDHFTHTATPSICKGCANHCHLTINHFADGERYISGNQCQRALGVKAAEELPNLYAWKRNYLASLKPQEGRRGIIGLPLALSTYELAPLWYTLLTALGFEVRFSRPSNRQTYERGQFSIPSDTVCYPAKLIHGHVMELLEDGITNIFYPALTMNVNERMGNNHYNCPIVAYYGETLRGNMEDLRKANFLNPYLSLDGPGPLARTLYPSLHALDGSITRHEVFRAAKTAFAAYEAYKHALALEGERALDWAKAHGKRVMILAGRPYHIDPEICHGIDRLAASLGFVVVSEDSVCHLAPKENVHVLDQWTFHTRLYRAARFAVKHPGCELVQLVSFGCGIDAITTDEARRIMEDAGRFYTQIKIDEITNLGAVRIRLRSLLGALEEKEASHAG